MKKLMIVIGLTVMLMLVAPLAILAASFQWSVNVTNSTSTAYSNAPFTAPISTASWISSNYIQSNGLDVKVMDGTTALPTEVTDTGLWWVGNIAKNTTKTFTLSTGNTPATSMPIIVGKDGYFVTPYVPGMDLGTHFSVIINADFDMTKIDTIMQTGSFYIGMGGHNLYAEIDEPDNERDFEFPNVTSGVHTLMMSGDGSHYRFSLDSPGDPDYQTQSVTETTGVPQSGQAWDWDSANGTPYNTMPYINSIQVQITPTNFSGNSITSMIFADSYVFAGIRNNSTGDVSILKIDPGLGTVVDTWDLGMTASIYGIPCLYYDGTDLYAGLGIFDRSQFQTQAMIIQFTTGLSEVSDWEDSDFGFAGVGINLLTGGDGMIYGAGDPGSAGWGYGVVQIDPSDMQKVGSYEETTAGDYAGNPLTEGGNEPLNGIALVGDSLYCAETYTPGASFCGVFIIQLAFYGLDQEGAHRIFTDEITTPYANYTAEQLTTDGTSLYCGIEETLVQDSSWVAQPYKVVKIDTAMDVFATYTTSHSLFDGVSSLLLADGTLYVGTWTNNSSDLGDIETVNPDSMLTDSETWEATSGSSISGITGMIFDGSYLDSMYSSVSSGSTDILQLDPTALTLDNTINIAATAPAFNLLYQPNTIIQGTDLPNLDDDTHATDGLITWGTCPSGTTTTFGGFVPVTTATAPVGGGGGNPTSQYSSGMPPLTSEGNFSNIPGSGVIDPILNSSGIPLDLFWDILIFAGILGLGFAIMVWTREIWIVGVACSVGFAIFSYNTNNGIDFTGGVLPFWTVIVCIMATIIVGVMQDRG